MGYYSGLTGYTACVLCPAGTYCPSSGMSVPTTCADGTYSIAPGAVACLATGPGYYAKGGDTAATACQAGSYCVGGQGAPVLCAAGTYSPSPALSVCTPTPAGYYNDAGQSAPIPCADGTYQPLQGGNSSSACRACSAGYGCPSGSTYQNNNPTCVVGTYLNLTNSTCLACPSGSFCRQGSTAPTPCGVGTFMGSAGASACASASAGYFVSTTGATAQTACAAGSYVSVVGASTCLLCTAGTNDAVTTGRTTACPLCAANAYCPNGTYAPSCPANTKSSQGATSAISCVCQAGYACSYTKRISATVTLNTTQANFNGDIGGVKSSFLAAIAAAAGVPVPHKSSSLG